ncbi:hypothetical protein A2376_02695 [Candidatus Woesebacteria bacterium RIFOXYB1_FULL_47_31]|uniref:Uncharacterized protein n=2 Tax=Candidatus Woeseibacteriota TaxID=1752722 RepID=A0A1F8D7I8_9BACT|nr:MAG: hypothetical protein A2376_02695 [Candidatus Woesebacteria bacterium RIFOXYB1_FULL_47_31]OGM89025.1 MAG: hypothetical protein A2597_00940 [Candidatus Woesebacteria bacterium RIFOXYD1_FULL_46_19]
MDKVSLYICITEIPSQLRQVAFPVLSYPIPFSTEQGQELASIAMPEETLTDKLVFLQPQVMLPLLMMVPEQTVSLEDTVIFLFLPQPLPMVLELTQMMVVKSPYFHWMVTAAAGTRLTPSALMML